MTQFSVDPNAVAAVAGTIRAEQHNVDQQASVVNHDVTADESVSGHEYRDQGAAYARAVRDHLGDSLQNYRDALDKVATALQNSADSYAETERANAKRVSS